MGSSLTVNLGERSYPIVIGAGLLNGNFELHEYVTGPDCLVVTNETIAPLYLDALTADLGGRDVTSINLRDGERF
ncbi:MAG: 3-dehydroquinate synthase, partial [Woeseiaceae bacterium]